MTFDNILATGIKRCSEYRSIERFLKLPVVRALYDVASETEKSKLNDLVLAGDSFGVQEWMRRNSANELEEMSMRQLRERAKTMWIKHYNILTRRQLIQAIAERKKNEPVSCSDEGRNT